MILKVGFQRHITFVVDAKEVAVLYVPTTNDSKGSTDNEFMN